MRYKVYGTTTVNVTIEVTASSVEEALIAARSELNGLTQYVGNGSDNKVIGVDGVNESVSADDEINWTTAEEIESEEDG
jgi:hypothetical protein